MTDISETRQEKQDKENKDDFLVQGSILALAAILTRIIGVLYRIPLTNILGDEGNGFYGYAYQVYAIALMLSSYSLPTVVSKLVSARLAKKEKRNAFRVFQCSLAFAVVVGLLISMAIFMGAGLISTNLMKASLSVYALRVLAPGLFIVAVMAVFRGYFQGMGTMVPTAVSQIIEQIINAIVSIVGASVLYDIGSRAGEKTGEALLGPAYGAAGSTLGTVSGALSGLIFLLAVYALYRKRVRKRRIREDAKDGTKKESYPFILKAVIMTAIPVIFSTAIYNINQVVDLTIFNNIMAAQGYTEQEYMSLQGIFTGKYDTLINIPMAIANALGASVVPSLTRVVTTGTKNQIYVKINQTFRMIMLICAPCCIGYIVLASPIMVFLFNDASVIPARLLMIGAPVAVFYGMASVSNSILHGLNYMSSPAKNAAVALCIHLAAFVVMMAVLKWNVYSLVGGSMVFGFSMFVLNQRKIRKVCGYRMDLLDVMGKPFAASILMGAVTFAVYHGLDKLIGGRVFPVLISIVIAIVVYALTILKTGILSREDVLELPMGARLARACEKFSLFPKKKR